MRFPGLAGQRRLWWVVLLVAADVGVFVLLGNHLINRLVLGPLAQATRAAQAIAGGDLERRVPLGPTREHAELATAFNTLTDQLLRDQARLADNVQSLDQTNQRLVDAQRELAHAEKLAAIGRLAAGVAHEIGNPLGALLGYVGLLRRRGADTELIDGVQGEARRIDRIVRGLLSYARPGTGPLRPTDLNAAVRGALERVRAGGGLASTTLSVDLAPELPALKAAPDALEQVLVNLFANADAALGGGGELRVETRRERYANPAVRARRMDDPPEVDYSHLRRTPSVPGAHGGRLHSGDRVVRVTVSDNGPGIAAEHLSAVWDPFFTTKAPGQGTGLGLAIVASTVAELGGEARVESSPGAGATFSLFFPIPEDPA